MNAAIDPGGKVIGRYALYGPIARGGMATVFFGRLRGPAGFARTVAIKRLHPEFADQQEFVSMFVDEARLAARVRSPHVVSTLDVVAAEDELFLVMDYVAGESLGRLVRAASEQGTRVPFRVAVAILSGALEGLHAAHEAQSEAGLPLGIVHRDVSPQNILVGIDGLARVLDFGVAKATGRLQSTRAGELKGKLSYMPPEQLRHEPLTRRGDIYSASVVLWEVLTGERLFAGDDEASVVTRVLVGRVERPSQVVARIASALGDEERAFLESVDPIVLRGLDRDPSKRFDTAGEMALALERCAPAATAREVSEWVERMAGAVLAERAARVAEIESGVVVANVVPSEVEARAVTGERDEPRTQTVGVTPARQEDGIPRRAWWSRAALGGALLFFAAGILLVLHGRGPAPAPQPIAPVAPSEASGAALPPPAPPAPIATVSPPSEASLLDAGPSSVASRPPPAAPGPRATPRKPKPTPSDCTPPFSWDAQGKKHYKPQCM